LIKRLFLPHYQGVWAPGRCWRASASIVRSVVGDSRRSKRHLIGVCVPVNFPVKSSEFFPVTNRQLVTPIDANSETTARVPFVVLPDRPLRDACKVQIRASHSKLALYVIMTLPAGAPGAALPRAWLV
jgi:hypothetical protein